MQITFNILRARTPLWLTILFIGFMQPAQAGITINLDLVHGFNFYYPTLSINADSPPPITFHRVQSPSGAIWRQTNSSGAPSHSPTTDLNALIDECTNGLWHLTLNVGDASEEDYAFSVTVDNVTTGLFGDIQISYPVADSTITNHLPTFQWTSTSLLPDVNVSAYDDAHTVSLGAALAGTATNWTPFSALATGNNRFYPRYSSNNYAGVVFSTPTNLVGGTPLIDWNATADIRTYAIRKYVIEDPPTPILYEASFTLNIQRDYNAGSDVFHVYPMLFNTLPVATTTHEVESPNGLCLGIAGGASTSSSFTNLADAIAECEAGDWTIYYDRTATNLEYRFSVDIENIDTNVLARTVILYPENGATNLYGNPENAWSGPTGFTHVVVHTGATSETLAPTETAWPNAPVLAPGANSLSVSYSLTNHPGIGMTVPTNSSGVALDAWSSEGNLTSKSSTSFTVASGSSPYYITEPGANGGDFTLSFSTRPQFPFTVLCRTNLLEGSWEPVGSGDGTGAPVLFSWPATNPVAYYLVILNP